jgi:hypothetical protein
MGSRLVRGAAGVLIALAAVSAAWASVAAGAVIRQYPLHRAVVSTTFWVGEVFDPSASDGSQVFSSYDGSWMRHYGGCDGVLRGTGISRCATERRFASNGYFPSAMAPRENPFYLDLPFDDLNDPRAFKARSTVVPWAHDPGYAGHARDRHFSYMKNRWVKLAGPNGRTCYGQIEDAGPGQYDDWRYVFGQRDARPQNRRYGHAGMDVSPALNGCLGFAEINGDTDRVSWRFVERSAVPRGPWTRIETTRGVSN